VKDNNPMWVVSVNISSKRGTIKKPVPQIKLTTNGIMGDAHAGEWHRQICMLSEESANRFASNAGIMIEPGELAENITTHGINVEDIAILDRFKIGETEIEVTQIGKVIDIDEDGYMIVRGIRNTVTPKEGIFLRVIKGGVIKANDKIDHIPRFMKFMVITLSDRISKGKGIDKSGPKILEMAENFFRGKRWHISFSNIVLPDDSRSLRRTIQNALTDGVDFIVTTGGTGISPRDITVEVVGSMVEKTIPGIMEYIRVKSGESNPNALLSRSIAGLIGKSIIYTLPGSERAVREYMGVILKTLEHSVYMLNGIDVHVKKTYETVL